MAASHHGGSDEDRAQGDRGPDARAPEADTWVGLQSSPLSVGELHDWSVLPTCGAVVTFTGTARDHSDGREGVEVLEYEAYDEQVERRLRIIADEARRRWPVLGRVAMVHRTGVLRLGEAAVVVAVSAPHRGEAFAAASFCIDTLKATVPIWKRERWRDGDDWGLDATPIADVVDLSSASSTESPSESGVR